MSTPEREQKQCGLVGIVGRPNVGKSTLLNHLIGLKLSITSRKPQTTRHRVLGIKSDEYRQVIFVDTPGIDREYDKAINRYMNRAAQSAMHDVDIVLFVLDRTVWSDTDQRIADQLKTLNVPVVVAINKVDRIEDQGSLLEHLRVLHEYLPDADLVPVSALHKHNLDALESALHRYLPHGQFLFPNDQITDRSERFLAAELIREKITRQLGAELPYQVTVEIEAFEHRSKTRHIDALILVEREGQKKILIGEKGQRIKSIGQQARQDMEALYGGKVMLKTWVKVRSGWSDDERALRSLGYHDPS